jgi:hypothetical protein
MAKFEAPAQVLHVILILVPVGIAGSARVHQFDAYDVNQVIITRFVKCHARLYHHTQRL